MVDAITLAVAAVAGMVGGAMNALAGGGSFATMPTLIALGLPSPIANATSNVALQPGAITSAWAYRGGLGPLAGMSVRRLCIVTFIGGLVGSLLLVATPSSTFDVIIPWLLLVATIAIAFGPRAADWLRSRTSIGPRTLVTAQVLLGLYGGYFGGGVGMMMTATWGLLSGSAPHQLAAPRTLMLSMANAAATIVFVTLGMVKWVLCVPMLLGAIVGGHFGARLGIVLPPWAIRAWTLAISTITTMVFFYRAYL
ncbi:sulfite exporter TauE/SafE family protein [Sphingomonas sp.]|uniref:sulfite exporter TauE/SafE family protein n=1 Tax=Sphingomonas sp. TaxID=28214 RepID=UPI0025D5C60A|nr:sulfite exporter TauE/SafE family protein [Sphingomonas sp.]